MSVIHKECGTKVEPSGKGDFGHCHTCKKDVHHLVTRDGFTPEFSEGVIIK